MKKINLYILLFGISFIFILCSCEKEDDLKISEKKTQRFDLPQGNHDFDEQIVEWYNDYETAVLYSPMLISIIISHLAVTMLIMM